MLTAVSFLETLEAGYEKEEAEDVVEEPSGQAMEVSSMEAYRESYFRTKTEHGTLKRAFTLKKKTIRDYAGRCEFSHDPIKRSLLKLHDDEDKLVLSFLNFSCKYCTVMQPIWNWQAHTRAQER